jgi:hypothetical protein
VREVGVERALEGEGVRVVGQAAVHGAVAAGDVLVCEAGDELLLVAEALGSSCVW